ncbi:hypothetical protein OIU84_007089 [Salix udensis]|uniref:PB1 domain-containing protein n=1 Tax=Salix udensis TaxID=889485 RepID=A0AAD6JTK7_9ROSI|nr:hypothetical protein OIU84_007089 [Salix udensis]
MVMSDSKTNTKTETLKFLCSYSGKLLPRFSDGVLRYVGGLTRVLAVDRSISYAELMVKLGEFCGFSVELRCPLPNGDLETLISVKSEEELTNLIAEYDRSCPGSKIRAILFPTQIAQENLSADIECFQHRFFTYQISFEPLPIWQFFPSDRLSRPSLQSKPSTRTTTL